ncbi:eCIS core domain-containing protein [Aquimarina algicola]|uniref:DUF4157 domain-containing protein n=1 Tax=Aquimarina algicola TaxID=2589995 RepID=A0A504J0L0_9FLAO|nr:DUF4157 domain-containing protein [Aquimarina algicola]TPN83944.1 DUF4157 domain-containing protein [Aquimarina algicola]
MADKVVQRLSEPTQKSTTPVSETTHAVQSKFNYDEGKEKLQKKEDDEFSEADTEVQQKPIFESNAEPEADVQAKLVEHSISTIQRSADTDLQEEQVQEKEEELSEADAEVQQKPIFESNAEPEADVQAKFVEHSISTIQRSADTDLQEEQIQEKEEELSEADAEVQQKPIFESNAVPEADAQVKPNIFRKPEEKPPEEEAPVQLKKQVQTKSNEESTGSSTLQSQLNSSKGKGSPLSDTTRSSMESAFGADFSSVRVHTGSDAVQMNKDLGAQAFTHGSDIYFNENKYDTNSNSGNHLLAHELTHTIQQGGAVRQKPQKSYQRTQPKVQRFSLWDAARRAGRGIARGARAFGRGVVSGARAVGRGVTNLAQSALEMGKDALMAAVRRIAPDFARLIERDGIRSFLGNLIRQAFRSLFNGVSTPIRGALGMFGSLRQRITNGLGSMRTFIGGATSNTFNMARTAASSVGSFISGVVTPVFSGIRNVAGRVKNFFTGINEVIGVPIMNVLRRIGGSVWENFTGFIQRVGNVFNSVKNAIGGAWTRIKGWFGITADQGTGEGGGIWEWVKGKALALWNTIKQRIEPIKAPLQNIGSVLLLLSPAGPALALFRAWPYLQRAFNWVRQRWRDGNVLVRARQYLNTTLMPMLTNGLQNVGSGMIQASDWLIRILGRVQITANNFLGSLGSPILAPLRGIVNFALTHFRNMVTSVRNGIKYVSTHVSQIFRRIREFLMKVWEVVRRIIAIAVNPFGIAGLVLGMAWRALPDPVKGKIIDWIISILIRAIRAIPSNPILSFLWPFIKNGMIGFLERMLAFQTQRKVNASNKMATIMSGGSPSFAFGFLKGLAMGVWEGITGPFIMIRDLFQLPGLVMSFVRRLGSQFSEMMSEARQLISSLMGNAVGTFQSLLNRLQQLLANPRQIITIIRSAIEAAMNAVRGIGSSIAERLMNLMEQPDNKIGELLGNLVGQGLFEAVLAFFTAGGSIAAGAARQVANILRRVARSIMPIIRQIMSFLPRIRPFIQRLGGLFGRARTGASEVMQRIRRFIDRVMEWFQNVMSRMTGRGRRGRGRGRRGDTDGPDERRRRDHGLDENNQLRLRRAIARIRPPLLRLLDRGIGGIRLRARLAYWRVRYRLRRLWVDRSGNYAEIKAQVNPTADVQRAYMPRGRELRRLVNEVVQQLLSEPRVQQAVQRMRNSGSGTEDRPLQIDGSAGFTASLGFHQRHGHTLPQGQNAYYKVGNSGTVSENILGGRNALVNLSPHDYAGISSTIRQFMSQRGMTGRQMATAMRSIVRTGNIPGSLVASGGTGITSKIKGRLTRIAYLMFGREAVRIPNTIATGPMILDLIGRGEMTWQQALTSRHRLGGGAFPPSFKGAQGAQRGLEEIDAGRSIRGRRDVGTRQQRRLLISRENRLIKTWLQSSLRAEGYVGFLDRSDALQYIRNKIYRFYGLR